MKRYQIVFDIEDNTGTKFDTEDKVFLLDEFNGLLGGSFPNIEAITITVRENDNEQETTIQSKA